MKNSIDFFRENPFTRLLFPLITGIIIGTYTSCSIPILFFPLLLLILFIFPKHHLKHRALWGVLLGVFWIMAGVWLTSNKQEQGQSPIRLSTHYVKAIVRGVPEQKKTKLLIPLEIVNIKNKQRLKQVSIKVIAYATARESMLQWKYGDTIYTRLRFSKIPHNTNPHTFDYARLLSYRQIYHNAYLGKIPIIHKEATGFSVFRAAQQTQKHLTKIVSNYIPNKKVGSFLRAMTLGDRKSLSPTIKIDFVNTGVVHILAVSGLHVGILFLIINLLLRPLATNRSRRILVMLLGLFIIWSFAFISGLSISVIRAAIMFSGLQLSLLSLRPYKTYNTVAYSAILLLLYNPFNLFEVGFQLSYIAVLGIITINPILTKKQCKNPILRKFQQLITVSLSAQLSILPISLYYFHQLPTYFLVANIIILLFAPILLGGSLFLLSISWIPFLANIWGGFLSFMGSICLTLINKTGQLPSPILFQYSPDDMEVALWFGILLCVYFYYLYRNPKYWNLFLFFVLSSIIWGGYQQIRYAKQSTIIVHDIQKTSCYSFITGNNALVVYTDSLSDFTKTNILKPLWIKRCIKSVAEVKQEEKQSLTLKQFIQKDKHYLVGGKHIVIARNISKIHSRPLPHKITVDYLIFSENYTNTDILKYYKPLQIIIDASLPLWKLKMLKANLATNKIPLHCVSTMGTFIENID